MPAYRPEKVNVPARLVEDKGRFSGGRLGNDVMRVIGGRHHDPEEDAEEQGGVDISIIGRSFKAELAETTVAKERDAKQRSQEHSGCERSKRRSTAWL